MRPLLLLFLTALLSFAPLRAEAAPVPVSGAPAASAPAAPGAPGTPGTPVDWRAPVYRELGEMHGRFLVPLGLWTGLGLELVMLSGPTRPVLAEIGRGIALGATALNGGAHLTLLLARAGAAGAESPRQLAAGYLAAARLTGALALASTLSGLRLGLRHAIAEDDPQDSFSIDWRIPLVLLVWGLGLAQSALTLNGLARVARRLPTPEPVARRSGPQPTFNAHGIGIAF